MSISIVHLGGYHQAGSECYPVQLGVYLRGYSGVCSGALCELTWKRIVKQAGSVIGCNGWCTAERAQSVFESISRLYLAVCNNVHWAVLLNAVRCIVSQACNCMHIILFKSRCRSIGPHDATNQRCY
jgi:hypothetical protein